jgi:tetratricopeptide (TPR) repeat protein
MQKIIIFFIAISSSLPAHTQSNYEKYKALSQKKDTAKIKVLLADWEKSNPDDPELYTSAFNYWFAASSQELISLDQEQRSKEAFTLTDSTGAPAGYINSNTGYEPAKFNKGIDYINKGIQKFPNRLDMRFGKCYVLGEAGNYEKFTAEIIAVVEYSVTIKNNWLWTEQKKYADGESGMLNTVYDYMKQLYDTEDDNLLENMKQVGATTIKYYPGNTKILSITAVAHMLTKDYDKALGYLHQAEKLDPHDFILLNNIAQGYKGKGDKANAIKYFELTAKYGDAEAKQQSKEAIKRLKN